ncbi:MAG TPA: MFS transporter [Gemmatimonadales bacterium]|nr:MFS transporter [Gemmatimonadales bacterium]
MFLASVVNFIDRVNVSVAALQMNRDLGFSATVYGLGAGMLSIGYTLFQIPSNLALARVGARRWIAALMLVWGGIASSMMFVRGAGSFYFLRFLLGAAEAGFFPGMMLYLTRWFPGAVRARAVAAFMSAIPVAQAIGTLVSGLLLGLGGRGGLTGWQWLFLLEGLPAVVIGVAVFALLTDRPDQARWLPADERAWLEDTLRREGTAATQTGWRGAWAAFRDPTVWRLGAVWAVINLVGFGQLYFLPQIIKGASQLSDLAVASLSTLPPLAAAVAMLVIAAHSDRTGERRRHLAGTLLTTAIGFAATAAVLRSPVLAAIALAFVAIGIAGAFGPFWGLATASITGSAAASIALISSIGQVGAPVGSWLFGRVRDVTGGFAVALLGCVALAMIAALAVALRPAGSSAGSAAAR